MFLIIYIFFLKCYNSLFLYANILFIFQIFFKVNLVSKRRFKYSFAFISSILKFQVVGFCFKLFYQFVALLHCGQRTLSSFHYMELLTRCVVHYHEFPWTIVQKVYRNYYIIYIYIYINYYYISIRPVLIKCYFLKLSFPLCLSFLLHFLVSFKKNVSTEILSNLISLLWIVLCCFC